MSPAEATMVPSQCLGNILQEPAEKTKQNGQQGLRELCTIYSNRGLQTNDAARLQGEQLGFHQPAPASGACSSVVGKVIDEPRRDVQLGDFLQPSDAGGPPQAHPAEL